MKYVMQFIVCLAVMAVPLASVAADKQVDTKAIDRAEKYLQDMKTAQARFVQTTHNGTQLVGTFYLQRPGKLRFEYDPPMEDFIVADGVFIYFYDAVLEEQTNAPIQSTLANFFLRKNFSFDDDLMVKEAKYAGGLLQIKVVQADDQDAGSIIFAFGEKPFELKKWRIIDGQGMITEVELFYLKTGMKHDPDLFVYADPNRIDGKPIYND
ncbi:MAG: outer membrane lipocarrier LolA family protein [Alphaproteobacteria bacterium]|nr:MAG: outer membrane lipocarrier LolA family protein [Alphaproteobacteria bacterium]